MNIVELRKVLISLAGSMLLFQGTTASAATLNLSQQPLFLTQGVAPNIMVTMDNSGSMIWGFVPDALDNCAVTSGSGWNQTCTAYYRDYRRTKANSYNGAYYNPSVTYIAPYSVSYSSTTGNLTVTQLTTSFTSAYVNGFKTGKGTVNLSNGYKVSWYYDPGTTLGSTYVTDDSNNGTLAKNPSTDYGPLNPSSYTAGAQNISTAGYSGSSTKTNSQVINGVTVSITYKSSNNTCSATITNPSPVSTTPQTTTSTNSNTGATVTTSSYTTTSVSYGSVSCSVSTSGSTRTYTINSSSTITVTPYSKVSRSDMTTSAVPAYYYLYDTTLSGCTSNTNDDNCYRLVAITSSSGVGGRDERQNFAIWYSFYRTRSLAAQSSANIGLVNLSSNTRLGWQSLALNDSCQLNSTTCKGIDNSGYDIRLRNFNGQHRADFFKWLGDISYGDGTPLRTALSRVGDFLTTTNSNNPYAYDLGNTISPEYACRPTYHMMVTDGLWNTDSVKNTEYDNATQTLPDSKSYAPALPYQDTTSNTLSDLAFKYWATDARTNIDNKISPFIAQSSTNATTQYWNPRNDPATWQHLVNFFVGIGLGSSLTQSSPAPQWTGDTYSFGSNSFTWPAATSNSANNVYDLWHAAINSRGEFFSADSTQELLSAMQNIVLRITQRVDSGASPALVTSPLLNNDSAVYSYTPKFSSADWSGDLIKYQQNTATGIQSQVWSAQTQMNNTYGSGNSAFSSRVIKIADTASTSKLKDFTWGNLSSAQQTSLNQTFANVVDTNGSARVDFIRGDRSNEGGIFRTRTSVLGDIIDSSPVLVGPPSRLEALMNATNNSAASDASSYTTFKSTNASRATRVYVGANDGMLHAFDDSGNETFAFIPSAVMPSLYKLPDNSYTSLTHQYYVDGPPVVADVYFNSAWHTVLVGSLRGGGRAMFALDITNPSSVSLLWEKSASDTGYSDLGFTYSRPTITKLATGQWAVVTGNGYNSTSDKAVLYTIDISNGSIIKAITVSDGNTAANGLSTPRVADINGDLVADYAYAGDLHGNLWRFDLTSANLTSATPSAAFGGTPLYTAKSSNSLTQPITSAPFLARHPLGTGYIVIFGTGKYIESADSNANTTKAMSLYGIWDQQGSVTPPTLSRSSLQSQSLTNTDVSATFTNNGTDVNAVVRTATSNTVTWLNATTGAVQQYGWYLDLPQTGEMVVNNPYVTGDLLLASTLTPNTDPCADGVTTELMALNPYTGGATAFPALDLNNDGVIDGNDQYNGANVAGIQMPGLKGGFSITGSSVSGGLGGISGGSDGAVCGTSYCKNFSSGVRANGRQLWRNIRNQD